MATREWTAPDEGDAVEGHLTVAAVAARLGVAASTLRTWDRRYGLGPSGRAAGSHRRYSSDDLARLETMRALTDRGVALADAARIAIQSAPTDAPAVDLDPLSLAAAAVESGSDRLVRALRTAAQSSGVIEVLASRVTPALSYLSDAGRSDAPGRDPQQALESAMLAVVRERVDRAGQARRGLVLVVAARGQQLAAHVLAGALHEAGVRARVMPADDGEAESHSRCVGATLVIELHEEVTNRVEHRHSGGAHALLLVGAGAPRVPGAFRVRTLAAALPEAIDLVDERADVVS